MSEDDSPSWLAADRPVARAVPAASTPVALRAAVAIVAVLAAIEVVHITGRDDLVVGMRAFLIVVVALQVLFAVLTLRRSPIGAVGLLVYQVTVLLAATAGGFGEVRGPLAVGALAVVVLVARSLGAFPTPELPRIEP